SVGSTSASNCATNCTNTRAPPSKLVATRTGVKCPITKIAKQVTMLTSIGARVEIATLTAVIAATSNTISASAGRIVAAASNRSGTSSGIQPFQLRYAATC